MSKPQQNFSRQQQQQMKKKTMCAKGCLDIFDINNNDNIVARTLLLDFLVRK